MAILVAGGAGYIGSHVSKMLREKGFDVVVYDNLSHGYRSFARWGDFIEGDIGDTAQLDAVFKNYPVDAVMHFCAFIEVAESVAEPEKYYKNNVQNTIILLETMRKHSINEFIFSSTAAVYGMPEQMPIGEEDLKLPINPYGRSKLMLELILEDYAGAYDLRSIRFRYFNAAGADPEREIGEAHVPETHLIPLILDVAAGKRESVKVFGTDYETRDGTCVRDYIHVNDLADAHIRGAGRPLPDHRARHARSLSRSRLMPETASSQLRRTLHLIPMCEDDAPHPIEAIAARLDSDRATLLRYLKALSDRFDDDAMEMEEKIGDDITPSIEYQIIRSSIQSQIHDLLAILDEKEALVLKWRFGLDDDQPRTLQEIGASLGQTRERIRQIEQKAMRKLSHSHKLQQLRGYLN